MTIDEHISQTHQQSVSLYLQRQQIEEKLQQIQMQRMQLDKMLIELDGELNAYNKIKQEQENKDGK